MRIEAAKQLKSGDYVWTRIRGEKPSIVTVKSFKDGQFVILTQTGETLNKAVDEVEVDPYYLYKSED